MHTLPPLPPARPPPDPEEERREAAGGPVGGGQGQNLCYAEGGQRDEGPRMGTAAAAAAAGAEAMASRAASGCPGFPFAEAVAASAVAMASRRCSGSSTPRPASRLAAEEAADARRGGSPTQRNRQQRRAVHDRDATDDDPSPGRRRNIDGAWAQDRNTPTTRTAQPHQRGAGPAGKMFTHGPAASARAQVMRLRRAMRAESLLGGKAEEKMLKKNKEGRLYRAMRAVSFPAVRLGIPASRAQQAPAQTPRDNHLSSQRTADRLDARTLDLDHAAGATTPWRRRRAHG
jgi:hypothetical protein